MWHLKEAKPVWNHSNNEIESVVYIIRVASVSSAFKVSPTIIAYVKLQASDGLDLQTQNIMMDAYYLHILFIFRGKGGMCSSLTNLAS